MDYSKFNDYEILYLIKEGNECALALMFQKYETYITKIANSVCIYNWNVDDLIQEGRIVLYTCIWQYNADYKLSFFSFLTICLKRCFIKSMHKDDYYQRSYSFREELEATNDYSKGMVYLSEKLLEDSEDMELYRFVILDGFSLTLYAKKKAIPYGTAYRKYLSLIEKLKNII